MRVSQGNLRTTQVACATPPVVEEDAVIEGQPSMTAVVSSSL